MRRILTSIVLFFYSLSLLAAEITVAIDRKNINLDESFNLVFTANAEPDADPDFSPLSKDFEILGTRQASNVSIVNGRMQQSISWTVTLLAKQAGQIILPAISFGKDKSKQASVQINASNADPSQVETIFLQASVDTESPYVQAQVVLTVQLYFSQTPVNAALSEPEFEAGKVILQKLGDDKSYSKIIKGVAYEVVERQYALFPQSSGELLIPALTFRGDIGRSRNGFFADPFARQQGKTIVKRTEPIVLNVQAIPDAFSGKDWLPAKSMRIEEHWSVEPNKITAGEPVTRTLKLIAEGLPASQLPLLKAIFPDAVSQYPDQPTFSEKQIASGVEGVREDKTALIINNGGDYTLRAMQIPWWNTETDSMSFVELPERTITVKGTVTATANNSNEEQPNSILDTFSEPSAIEEQGGNNVVISKESYLWKFIALLFAVLWLLTLFFLVKKNKHNKVIKQKSEKANTSKTKEINQLQFACKNDEPEMVKSALINWARLEWPNKKINNLDDIAQEGNEEFKEEILLLNSALYSNAKTAWRGYNLLTAFSYFLKNDLKQKRIEEAVLEPLYKI